MSGATEYLASAADEGRRADAVLARAFPEHSRAAVQRAFEAGLVRRREQVLKKSDRLREGDQVSLSFPETKPLELRPRPIPLDVLFEDKHLLAVNKPAGMVVHPGAGTGDDTLVHALLAHCAGSLSGIGGVERPGIVHRLDRETSGVMVVAKTDAAHRALSEQFAHRTVEKEYLALVLGVPGLLSGSIRKPIGRHPTHRHKMTVFDPAEAARTGEDDEGGSSGSAREAHTDWVVVERFGDRAALLRCTLHSGRTHQIRVHLKSIGHVLLGDTVYGYKPRAGLPEVSRVMLHAERIAFVHPKSGKRVELRAALPADFEKLIADLRSRTVE